MSSLTIIAHGHVGDDLFQHNLLLAKALVLAICLLQLCPQLLNLSPC